MGVCLLGEEKGLLPKAANHFQGQSLAKKEEATESKLVYRLQNVPFPEVMVNYVITLAQPDLCFKSCRLAVSQDHR